jgi:DNA-directed RNA polymerase III subunit Rpc31
MAGRGGRGGRGGGPSYTKDAAAELGLDDLSTDNAPPPLYPPIELQAPYKLEAEERYMLRKGRELLTRMQNSPYYLKQDSMVTDVERWSEKGSAGGQSHRSTLEDCLVESTPGSHLPPELIGNRKVGMKAIQAYDIIKPKNEGKAFSSLLEKERRSAAKGDVEEEKKEEEEPSDLDDLDPEDIDDDADNDYGQDYYASADSDNAEND